MNGDIEKSNFLKEMRGGICALEYFVEDYTEYAEEVNWIINRLRDLIKSEEIKNSI